MGVSEVSHFFAYLARMKFINRWGLMRNTHLENIQEHSLQVAMIAHGLAIIKNKFFNGTVNPERAAVIAMFHEVSEIITGDLATPIKYYNPEIKKVYGEIELIARKKIFQMLPIELQPDYERLFTAQQDDSAEHKLVKVADKICAYLKCIEELKVGNQEFSQAEASIKKEIDSFQMPEVDYFMQNFVPSFSLTIDELD
jgi:5'-deoxynucleotidase